MNERDNRTIEMMEKYGGSFVKAMAAMLRHADSMNFIKTKVLFNDYWNEYEKMGDEWFLRNRCESCSGRGYHIIDDYDHRGEHTQREERCGECDGSGIKKLQ